MPEWLLKNENYVPMADKDTFVNKSILSFMGILSKIRAQDNKPDKFKVNAFLRVLFTLALIVMVSLSKTLMFLYIAVAYLLVILCVMPIKDVIGTLKTSAVMTLVTAVILLPTVFSGNNYSIVMIPAKVCITIIAVNILSRATRWDQITVALKRFHLPDLFIFVMDITLKYIVMLGELTLEMLHALKLRSVGKNKSKYTALSGVAGTLFIISRETAEEMYGAMECRGFTGEYRIFQKFTFGLADVAYLLINSGLIYLFIYLYHG